MFWREDHEKAKKPFTTSNQSQASIGPEHESSGKQEDNRYTPANSLLQGQPADQNLLSDLFLHYCDKETSPYPDKEHKEDPQTEPYPSIKGNRELFFQYIAELNKRISDICSKIDILESKREERAAQGKDTSRQAKDIAKFMDKKARIDEALHELEVLGNSEQEYNIGTYEVNNDSQEAGRIQFDKNTQQVQILITLTEDLDISVMQRLGHELKHAYQFETGKASLSYSGGAGGSLHDVQDEVEAYQRCQDLGYNENEKIDADWVRRRGEEGHQYQFSDSKSTQLTMDTETGVTTLGKQLRAQIKNSGKRGEEPREVYKGWKQDYEEGVKEQELKKDPKQSQL